MTSFAKEWQEDYESVRGRVLQCAQGATDEWIRQPQVERLAASLQGLEDRLSAMERKPTDFAVGLGELGRRRAALNTLHRDLEALGGSKDGNISQGAVGAAGTSRLEQQRETMREHDRMLSELGKGVGRLKTQSALINEETSLHVRLLDDMEGDAERASSGLRSEARHAERIRAKTKTFNLYVIIFILSVILIILIFAGI